MFPLFPGTPLSPTSLLALKQSQLCSAVSLLDFYCCKNNWSEPEYQLFSTPGPDRTLLLIYKVFALVHNYMPVNVSIREAERKSSPRKLHISHSDSSQSFQTTIHKFRSI